MERTGGWLSLVNGRVRRVEVVVWCLLAALAFAGRAAVAGGPGMSNDGYQYLSVAKNFADGRAAQTTLVHFDTERSWGTIPAPLTTFPSGYPLVVSIGARAGTHLDRAGMLVSALATLVLLFLYAVAGRLFALGGLPTRLMAAWTILNAQVAGVATAVATEALFTTLTFAAVLCFAAAAARDDQRKQVTRFVAAGALVGAAYWVRYAGLFYFAGLCVLAAWLVVARGRRALAGAAAAVASAAVPIALGLLRNQRLVGTWKGGNTMKVHHSAAAVLSKFVASVHHVFLGERVRSLVVFELAFLGSVAVAVFLLVRRRARASWRVGDAGAIAACLVVFAGVYSAAMIYAGIASPISFGPRMFYPLLPVALLLGALLLSVARDAVDTRIVLFLGAATVSYAVINVHHLVEAPSPAPHQLVERELAEESAPGETLRRWLDANVGRDETIVSNRGQATGYVLDRRAVSLIAHEYSQQSWDEDAVAALMHRFGARWLVVYTDGREDVVVTSESPLLARLARGEAPPPWLTVAARTRDVIVLRAQ
jgi:hypothetical protein